MATFYSDSTNLAQNANPPGELKTVDQGGRVRVLTASCNITAATLSTDLTFLGQLPSGSRVLRIDTDVPGPMPTLLNVGTLCASVRYGIISCTTSQTKTIAVSNTQAFLNVSMSGAVSTLKTIDTLGTVKNELNLYLKATSTVSVAGSVLLAVYYVLD